MQLIVRAALVFLAVVVGAVAAFVGAFVLTIWLSSCDHTKYVCDAAPMGGIGLGILVAPGAGVFCGWLAYRFLRDRAEPPSRAA